MGELSMSLPNRARAMHDRAAEHSAAHSPRRGLGEAKLQDEPTRVRISLLAFDEAAPLWRAAQDLLINGFKAGQFCLIGLPSELAILQLPTNISDDLRYALTGLIAKPSTLILSSTSTIVETRCGRHAASLFVSAGDYSQAMWIRPELSRSLANDTAMGRVVLLVTSHSADQHALGARLLLRHSSHDLKTHEFSMPHREPT